MTVIMYCLKKNYSFGFRSEELLEHISGTVINGICDMIRYIKRSLRPKDIGRYRLVLVQVVDRILDLKPQQF